MLESVVTMPALGESVTEGTVSRWLKNVGDEISADEPLLEVSTDKVDSEVPSPVTGILSEILVPADETVNVDTVLCKITQTVTNDVPSDNSEPIPSAQSSSFTQTSDNSEDDDTKDNITAPPTVNFSTVPERKITQRPSTPPPALSFSNDNSFSHSQSALENAESDSAQIVESEQFENSNFTNNACVDENNTNISQYKNSYVTPIVRKLARENNIDLSKIVGTGVDGRIRRKDVQDAIDAKNLQHQNNNFSSYNLHKETENISNIRGQKVKMTRLRQVISRRMMESLNTSAQLTSVVEVDCSHIWNIREKNKSSFLSNEGIKLTFLPFFVKIASHALKNHPKLNASIIGDEIYYHNEEHIGIAVDTQRGLIVPVIKNINNLSITGIAKSIVDLAKRGRDNKLNSDELSGSTFTITNTGSGGSIIDTPIINQPEVAILAIGKIVKRPVVVIDNFGNETIGIRPMAYLCLSYDHRLIDGADASRYLTEIKNVIENGDFNFD